MADDDVAFQMQPTNENEATFSSPPASPNDTLTSPMHTSASFTVKEKAAKRRRRILARRLAIAKKLRQEGTRVDKPLRGFAAKMESRDESVATASTASASRRIAMGTSALRQKRKSSELLSTPEKIRANTTPTTSKRRSLSSTREFSASPRAAAHQDTPTKMARFTPLRQSYMPTLRHINEQVVPVLLLLLLLL